MSVAVLVSLGQHIVLAAEILGGQRVGIRTDKTLSFFDLDTRQLLRVRPNRSPSPRRPGCAARSRRLPNPFPRCRDQPPACRKIECTHIG
ncbi:hypothetical protein AB0B57_36685 [Micromonospora sp. NPDC049101]|uniref:hypothetical protein n=1 Tax=Micromonospora sp. NPDC049101 TaxID=3155032 RepID=UPI0033E5750D